MNNNNDNNNNVPFETRLFVCTLNILPKASSLPSLLAIDEMSCIFIGDSSSQHVITRNILVTIGILIKRGKMLHQKRGSNKYVLPLENWVDWTTTRPEKKCHNLKNVHFGKLKSKCQICQKSMFITSNIKLV